MNHLLQFQLGIKTIMLTQLESAVTAFCGFSEEGDGFKKGMGCVQFCFDVASDSMRLILPTQHEPVMASGAERFISCEADTRHLFRAKQKQKLNVYLEHDVLQLLHHLASDVFADVVVYS